MADASADPLISDSLPAARIDLALRRDRGRFRALLKRRRVNRRRLEEELEASIALRRQRLALEIPLRYPADLPVTAHRQALLEAISRHQVIVVCGETGSGKSTQLPKLCLELGLGREGLIGHTQPRRIAARSIAMRVREEIDATAPGQGARVGYQVRFSDTTDPLSAIKLMTDGILLQEVRQDRLLQAYDAIIVDEAHERSLNIDLLLGHLHAILPRRPDLKLILTSATLDSVRFAEYFQRATGKEVPVLEVEGRTYPVQIRYLPPQADEEGDGGHRWVPAGEPLQRSVIRALEEIRREWPVGRGDVLIFLPTEREIHSLRRSLEGYLQHHSARQLFDLLPLYARLSPAEQQRVFMPSGQRTRLVLATNVAESSLTVPGIRYVIDTGTARISRYSARSGIQRLPIEPIAQANCNQRSGRCGRVGPGVCYRLYDAEDFTAREPYAQPEIQRSGLSGVILQMMTMGFEAIERFPFLDPPRPAMIRAGRQTLLELGALDSQGSLTDTGRKLAALPVDPRVGRIILAGAEEKCLAEVLIIAAALEGQDPRLQPLEHQQAARQAHQRYDDPEGDFIALLKLWDFYQELKSTHSRSSLKRACEKYFLSEARLREWGELHRQLKDLARAAGLSMTPRQEKPAAPLHQALLTGLLSRVAMRVEREPKEKDKPPYLDPAGQGFHLWPGSSLQRRQATEPFTTAEPEKRSADRAPRPRGPRWLVAAATLETSHRYLLTAGRIDPGWIEPLAGHLVRRQVSHPRWERHQGRVVADEKVSLGALVLVPRRPVDFGHHDLPAARSLFIQQALIEGDADISARFFAHNAHLVTEARQLEARTRQSGLAISDEELFSWYDRHLPPEVCSVPTLNRYLKSLGPEERKNALHLTKSVVRRLPIDPQLERQFPQVLQTGRMRLPLAYHQEEVDPAQPRCVRLTLPLIALNQVRPARLSWLVPGLLEATITALIRSLPKEIRRGFVPAPTFASRIAQMLSSIDPDAPEAPSLPEAVAAAMSRIHNEPVQAAWFDLSTLPADLKMQIQVVDDRGEVLAEGTDLAAMQITLADQAQTAIAKHRPRSPGRRAAESYPWQGRNLTRWTIGALPEKIEVNRGGVPLEAYPALADVHGQVEVVLLDTLPAARTAMTAGLRRLCEHAIAPDLKPRLRSLSELGQIQLYYAPLSESMPLLEAFTQRITQRAFLDESIDGWQVRDAEAFTQLLTRGHERLPDIATDTARRILDILKARQQVALRLENLQAQPLLESACKDLQQQLKHLFMPGFLVHTPWNWLMSYPRYLAGMEKRMEKLTGGHADRDSRLQQDLRPWLQQWDSLDRHPVVRDHSEIELLRWMLEEWRVSLFAQELGTSIPISTKRLERQMKKVERLIH